MGGQYGFFKIIIVKNYKHATLQVEIVSLKENMSERWLHVSLISAQRNRPSIFMGFPKIDHEVNSYPYLYA